MKKTTESTKLKSVPPEEFTDGVVLDPVLKAAGLKGVTTAIKHLSEEGRINALTSIMPKLNQFDGFDCPGCAWPDPDEKRSFLGEYCENGAKAIAEETTTKKAGPDFWTKHSIVELSNWSDYELGKSGRITHPMVVRPGDTHYSPIDWKEAFELIKEELSGLKDPNEAIFYTSGRASNEAAYLYQLFVRSFGTNNMPDCSNLCHESSGVALNRTLGLGKGSVTLDDFQHAEVIMIFGQNPGTNHPRMLSSLEEAKRKGATVIAVNPLKEPGLVKFKNPQGRSMLRSTVISDHYLQVKINGDMPLLQAIMKILLEKEQQNPGTVLDGSFIQQHTEGFEALKDHLTSLDLDQLIAESGVDAKLVNVVADLLAAKKRIIICWAMGITQHKNGVATIQDIVNLLLMKGSIGIKGGGTCPVRGHSNVQGDRTMGIYEKPAESFLNSLEDEFGIKMPHEHGWDAVEAIEAMQQGKGQVFFALGGNFLSATPDTLVTAEGLQNCSLTVHVSTKPNRSHLVHGKSALILPCLGRSETDEQPGGVQFVTVENSMGVVHKSEGDLDPASDQLKSETRIVAEMANAVFGESHAVNWLEMADNYDLIRDRISKTIPGFENFNTRVRKKGGFYLPNGPRERKFTNAGEKALFTRNSFEKLPVEKGQYILMTIRSHDQFNTTIYGLDDRYRGVFNERRVLFMNPEDMAREGLKKEDVVDLTSHYKGEKRHAYRFLAIPFDIPKGSTAAYFPETNVLVPLDSTAEESNTPTSKGIVISVQKA